MARYANEQGLTTVPMRRRRTRAERLAEEDEEIRIEPMSRAITANSCGVTLPSKGQEPGSTS